MKNLLRTSSLVVVSGTAAWAFVTWPTVSSVQAQSSPSLPPERVIDRVALALTNKLPSAELKRDFLAGKKKLQDIVAELVKSEDFLTASARFWMTKLKLNGVVDFENINSGGRSVLNDISPGRLTENSLTLQWSAVTFPQTFRDYLSANVVSAGYYRLEIDTIARLQGVANNEEFLQRMSVRAKYDCARSAASLASRSIARNNGLACPAPGPTDTHYTVSTTSPNTCVLTGVSDDTLASNVVQGPWFAPSDNTQVMVCPGIVDRCGSNLERCFPSSELVANSSNYSGPANAFLPNLREDFTIEPGMIAAGIIQNDRPWEDVLRGTDGPMTGTMEKFLSNSWGSRILANMPPGSYKDGSGESTLDSNRSGTDRSWKWKERGGLHAGVLTTMAFQKATNGWRAKAALSLEAFLCRQFAVPEGVAVLPSAEVDLTRKPYCQSCHSVLEPLSYFFGRWPNVGNTNYSYNPTASVVSSGVFEGMSNADTNGLAKVYTSTQDFHTCGVTRAFEFMVGREMSPEEVVSILPRLTNVYQSSGGRIAPVFKEIAKTSLFGGGQ